MSGLLANERKARWIGTGTWSDSGLDPNRLITYPRCTQSPFYCSVRVTYNTNQIVAVNDLYYQWTDGGCSHSGGCGCQGDCGHIANYNCNPNTTYVSGSCSYVWGCLCYAPVGANCMYDANTCWNGADYYWYHGNCAMNACNGGTQPNCYSSCHETHCWDYCMCALGEHGCQCNDPHGTAWSWSCWCNNACRNCPSDQTNSPY